MYDFHPFFLLFLRCYWNCTLYRFFFINSVLSIYLNSFLFMSKIVLYINCTNSIVKTIFFNIFPVLFFVKIEVKKKDMENRKMLGSTLPTRYDDQVSSVCLSFLLFLWSIDPYYERKKKNIHITLNRILIEIRHVSTYAFRYVVLIMKACTSWAIIKIIRRPPKGGRVFLVLPYEYSLTQITELDQTSKYTLFLCTNQMQNKKTNSICPPLKSFIILKKKKK